MAKKTKSARSIRHARGFERAGVLIGQQTGTATAKRGYLLAKLQSQWAEIAGGDLRGIAWPVKLVIARGPAGGLLTLAVDGAHAPQIQMMLPTLRERINTALGPGVAGRIQLVQGEIPAMPPRTPVQPEAVEKTPVDLAPLAGGLSSIGDDDLRGALETLARNVLSRSE